MSSTPSDVSASPTSLPSATARAANERSAAAVAPLGRASRAAAILALLAGAALLLLAAYRPAWFIDDEARASIGLRAMTFCLDDACRSESILATAGDATWARTGTAAFVASLIAAGLAVGLAGALAAGRRPRWLARLAVVAAVTSGIAGAIFVVQFPGYGDTALGSSAWLHFGGAALAALGWAIHARAVAVGTAITKR